MKNIYIICLISFFLILFNRINAQQATFEWVKQIGGIATDESRSIEIDNNGNIYIVGIYNDVVYFENDSLNSRGTFIAKYNTDGDLIWIKQVCYNNNLGLSGTSLTIDDMNNIYISGKFKDTVNFADTILIGGAEYYPDIFIAKYDFNGNYKWVKQIKCEYCGNCYCNINSSKAFNDGVYFIGNFYDTLTFSDTVSITFPFGIFFIAKYDTNGNFLWVKQSKFVCRGPRAISIDNNNNFYVTGYFSGIFEFNDTSLISMSDIDIIIAKYDSEWNIIWARQGGGGSNFDMGKSISIDSSNNNIYITGIFQDTAFFENDSLISNGGDDVFIAKYNIDGNLIWLKQAGGNFYDFGESIYTNNDNIYITGSFDDIAFFENDSLISNGIDIFIAKYDNNGNLNYVIGSNSNFFAVGKNIITDNNNNIYVVGSFAGETIFGSISLISNDPGSDIFIAKIKDITNSINEITKNNSFIKLYPNPNKGSFKISIPENANDLLSIEVTNILGIIVYKKQNIQSNFINIDISSHPKGIYFVKAFLGDEVFVEKIIYQ